jgi:hypothetical protein
MAVDAGFLYRQNEFVLIATLVALLFIATEIGYRRGRSTRARLEEAAKSHHSTLQTGVMGLLALLLAFTFSMSSTRYETRKLLLVDEANAIGTAWLRSGMLPEPYRSSVTGLLRDYTGFRLDYYQSVASDRSVDAALVKSRELQNQLWSQAVGVAEKDPRSIPIGLFISSLNDLIDVAARRDAARENHVPEPVLLFLFLVSILTMGLVGFGCGLGGHRNFSATAMICLFVGLVILVIIDLDRPRRGFIEISQQPMMELRQSLR